jgi:predicted transcriptional regulator
MDYTPKTFKMDATVAEDLEKIAKREERTQTAIVERALRAYIAQSKANAAAAEVNAKQAA